MGFPWKRQSAQSERSCLMVSLLLISLMTVLCQVYVLYHSHWTGGALDVSSRASIAPLLSRVRGVFLGTSNHFFNDLTLANGTRHRSAGNPGPRAKTPLGVMIDKIVQTARKADETSLRNKTASKVSSQQLPVQGISNSSQNAWQRVQTEKDAEKPRVVPAKSVPTRENESAGGTLRISKGSESELTNTKNVRGSLLILPVRTVTNSVPKASDAPQAKIIGGPTNSPPANRIVQTATSNTSADVKIMNVKSLSADQRINSADRETQTKHAAVVSSQPVNRNEDNSNKYVSIPNSGNAIAKLIQTAGGQSPKPLSAEGDNSIVADVVDDGFRRDLTTDGYGNVLCPETPPNLLGNLSSAVNADNHSLTLGQVEAWNRDLNPGGEWSPKDCVARYRLAIVIPYRDRLAHLTVLLAHLLPILKRQQLHFRIFVVEQYGSLTFNKGRIMNAAFKEALNMYDFHCVIFHDVDLIPEDDRNMYTCPVMPRHMSVAVDSLQYRLVYPLLVGGALNFRVEHFQQVNGYSNMYWGWGAEDDDMAYRIINSNLRIFRPPSNVARYKMIAHEKRTPTPYQYRMDLLKTAAQRFHEDGLSNLNYTVQFIHLEPLFTHIMVDIGQPS